MNLQYRTLIQIPFLVSLIFMPPKTYSAETCRSVLSGPGSYFLAETRQEALANYRMRAHGEEKKPERVKAFLKLETTQEVSLTQWTLPPNVIVLLAEEYALNVEEFQQMLAGGFLRKPQRQSIGYLYQITLQRPSSWEWREIWIFGFDPLHGPRIVEDLVLR